MKKLLIVVLVIAFCGSMFSVYKMKTVDYLDSEWLIKSTQEIKISLFQKIDKDLINMDEIKFPDRLKNNIFIELNGENNLEKIKIFSDNQIMDVFRCYRELPLELWVQNYEGAIESVKFDIARVNKGWNNIAIKAILSIANLELESTTKVDDYLEVFRTAASVKPRDTEDIIDQVDEGFKNGKSMYEILMTTVIGYERISKEGNFAKIEELPIKLSKNKNLKTGDLIDIISIVVDTINTHELAEEKARAAEFILKAIDNGVVDLNEVYNSPIIIDSLRTVVKESKEPYLENVYNFALSSSNFMIDKAIEAIRNELIKEIGMNFGKTVAMKACAAVLGFQHGAKLGSLIYGFEERYERMDLAEAGIIAVSFFNEFERQILKKMEQEEDVINAELHLAYLASEMWKWSIVSEIFNNFVLSWNAGLISEKMRCIQTSWIKSLIFDYEFNVEEIEEGFTDYVKKSKYFSELSWLIWQSPVYEDLLKEVKKNTISGKMGNMVLVEKGTFQMGDIWGDGAPNERPAHEVTFTYDYYIGEHEVTFEEYDKFCEETGKSKPNDKGWGRGQQPVINVSWWDAIEYCNWLSEKQGLPKAYDEEGNLLDKNGNKTTDITKVQGYRLPTEAEWEYAARGGNKSNGYKYAGSNDPDEVAWYCANSGKERINIEDYYYNEGKWEKVGTGDSAYYAIYVYKEFFDVIEQNFCKTHRIKQKSPNELGIYDMSGNVWEYCQDWYSNHSYESDENINPCNTSQSSLRVLRSGGWQNYSPYIRLSNRGNSIPEKRNCLIGFRIARTIYSAFEPIVEKMNGPDETVEEENVPFGWSGKDYDGKILFYEVRKDGSNWIPTGSNNSYTWANNKEGNHSFDVRAMDDDGLYSNKITWVFSYKRTNKSPNIISTPFPESGSTGIAINSCLSWSCKDPDDDEITFDIYLGKEGEVTLVKENYTYYKFCPKTLKFDTKYFWRIVAKDSNNNETKGPLWQFETINPGTIKWRFKTDGFVVSSPAISDSGIIYFGSDDGYLYALNHNGSVKWKFNTSDWVRSSPSIDSKGIIYFGNYKGIFYAIYPDGSLYWKYDLESPIIYSPALGTDGTIYVVTKDNNIYAFSSNGQIKWSFKAEGEISSSPIIGKNNVIYFGSNDNNVYAIDFKGKVVWKYKTDSEIVACTAIDREGNIIVPSKDGTLHILTPEGTITNKYELKTELTTSPSVSSNNTIYVGSNDGSFYAVKDEKVQEKMEYVDLVFVIDTSGSMDEENKKLLNVVGNIAKDYSNLNNRIAVAGFGDPGRFKIFESQGSTFTNNITEVESLINQLTRNDFGGNEAQIEALYKASVLQFRNDAKKILILITDEDTSQASVNNSLYNDLLNNISEKQLSTICILGNSDNSPKRDNKYYDLAEKSGGQVLDFYNLDFEIKVQEIFGVNFIKWLYKTGNTILSSPLVADNCSIFFGCNDGYLYALNKEGKLKWKFKTDDWIRSSPVLGYDGTIYFGSDDGHLYAVQSDCYSLDDSSWPMFQNDLRHTGNVTKQHDFLEIPNNPSPSNNEKEVSNNTVIEWDCYNSQSEEIKFDIYFGDSINPPLLEKNYSKNFYHVAKLENKKTYYWKIIAKNGNDKQVEGPLWKFTTGTQKKPPEIEFSKCYGGFNEEGIRSAQQTKDGGFIVAGWTESNDGDVSGYHGKRDIWIVKLDEKGTIQWQKCLGGTENDIANSVKQTSDGGYIIAGETNSDDGDVTGHRYSSDYWIVKLDRNGKLQWQKCFGGTGNDVALSLDITNDNGYIIAGYSNSTDCDITNNHGEYDYWILKLDYRGELQWQKSFGGTKDERAYSIIQTKDGGYTVAGEAYSNDGDVSDNRGENDYWIVKLNHNGDMEWQKTLGGTNNEWLSEIEQTKDNGYIVAGRSESNDKDITNNYGKSDFWIVKLDSEGEIIWEETYGGTNNDWAYSVKETITNGYIVAGYTHSRDDYVTDNKGDSDLWLIKLDKEGKLEWEKCYGGTASEWAWDIQEIGKKEYLISGWTKSNDGDVTGNHGNYDFWVMKLSDQRQEIEPIALEPKDGSQNVPTKTKLRWEFETTADFELTYDIYFGTDTNPPLKKTGHTSKSYDPGTLSYDTTYYWKIVVKDGKGEVTAGTVWCFKTKDEKSNSKGMMPEIAKESELTGTVDKKEITFVWKGKDPDGEIVKYEYRKDGNAWKNNGLKTTYTWKDYTEGEHTFEVRAQDNEGTYSNTLVWDFTYRLPVSTVEIIPLEYGDNSYYIDLTGIKSGGYKLKDGKWEKYGIPGGTRALLEFIPAEHGWKKGVLLIRSNYRILSFIIEEKQEPEHKYKVEYEFSVSVSNPNFDVKLYKYPPGLTKEQAIEICKEDFESSEEHDREEKPTTTRKMVLVEGGTFQMGDTWGDGAPNERPVHEVTFTYDYYIGEHEVTFEEYDKFCEETGKSKPNDKGWGRGQQPVINVSWWDAIEYCNWLSEKQGLPKAYDEEGNLLDRYGNETTDITEVEGYRLPTEAEWEYAARGGNKSNGYKYAGSNDPDEVAWYCANSGKGRINIEDYYYNEGKWKKIGTGDSAYYVIYVYKELFDVIEQNSCKTHRVKQKSPNELGIYDMSGNVWEFCHDLYDSTYYERSPDTNPYNHTTGSFRVKRGGGWSHSASFVRVAIRGGSLPDSSGDIGGFRVCRTAF